MGLLCLGVIAYFFASSCELPHHELRPWKHSASRYGKDGLYNIYNSEFEKHLSALISRWQNEIGYHGRAISVQPIFDEMFLVGACEISRELLDLADADEDERKEDREFAFYWVKDYLMSADGAVLAT